MVHVELIALKQFCIAYYQCIFSSSNKPCFQHNSIYFNFLLSRNSINVSEILQSCLWSGSSFSTSLLLAFFPSFLSPSFPSFLPLTSPLAVRCFAESFTLLKTLLGDSWMQNLNLHFLVLPWGSVPVCRPGAAGFQALHFFRPWFRHQPSCTHHFSCLGFWYAVHFRSHASSPCPSCSFVYWIL